MNYRKFLTEKNEKGTKKKLNKQQEKKKKNSRTVD
jgi:hypothetical protein